MKLKILLIVLLLLFSMKSSAEYSNLEVNDNTEVVIIQNEDITFTTVNSEYDDNINIITNSLLSINDFELINKFDYSYNKLLLKTFINIFDRRNLVYKNKSDCLFKTQLITTYKKSVIIERYLLSSLNKSSRIIRGRSP